MGRVGDVLEIWTWLAPGKITVPLSARLNLCSFSTQLVQKGERLNELLMVGPSS